MRSIFTRRWKSKFARFIHSYGVESLAVELNIRPSAIYHWISAATTPRPAHAEIIQRLARDRGSRLSLDDIYGHARTVRADERSEAVSRTLVTRAAAGGFPGD
jgi:hypothetical protein